MSAPPAIDLRSDSVTRPTPAMRDAMMRAEVGDDQFGDDPSVNALEARVADLLGHEAAVFVASGTMANQVALRVLTRPGDEVVVGGEAHVLWHETGAAAALAGVQVRAVGTSGLFTPAEFGAAIRPRGHALYPPTGLVVIENTHNRGGGSVFPQHDAAGICAEADRHGIATLLDGARLFNAAAATGLPVRTLAAPFRMAWVALSKGLGCPGGSVLAGSAADVAAARRYRRMYGGAMRQVGFFAAAGLHALDHHVARLAEDHANARLIAEALARAPGFAVDLAAAQTNIVIAHMAPGAPDAAAVVERVRADGVLIVAFGPRTIRATTHLGVGRRDCAAAAEAILRAAAA